MEKQILTDKDDSFLKRRDPIIAGILSFFCFGLGHIYCGKLKRGLTIFFVCNFIILCLLFLIFILKSIFIVIIFALVVISVYAFVITDAAKLALSESNYRLKAYNRWYVYILIYMGLSLICSFIVVVPMVKSMIMEAFIIPTVSMENTLLVQDFVVVDKLAYGVHAPLSSTYLIKYDSIKRGDVIIYASTGDRDEVAEPEKVYYIKRCIGLPGDTIQIKDKLLIVNGALYKEPQTIKFDSVNRPEEFANPRQFPKGSKWNEDFYGPIVVPKKGQTVKIDSSNFMKWEVFVRREGHSIELTSNNNIMLDGKRLPNNEYTVEKNYLFVLGDNRNNSLDSRYVGFIPENNVIGKSSVVYWSYNSDGTIRWERIGMKIH